MIAAVALAIAMAGPAPACEPQTKIDPTVVVNIVPVRSEDVPQEAFEMLVIRAVLALDALGIRVKPVAAQTTAISTPFGASQPRQGEGRQAHLRQSMAPLRAFTNAYVGPDQTAITVWVTRKIAAPSAPIRSLVDGPLLGLTIVDAPSGLGADAGLRKKPPVILLGLDAGATGRTLAHELGHAAGLPHREQRGALMRAQPDKCRPILNPMERAAFSKLAERTKRPPPVRRHVD